jgi:hypothetical protein
MGRLLVALLLLRAAAAVADEPPPREDSAPAVAPAASLAPPPDPTRGERYDGRLRAPPARARGLLIVPRILFAPIRYLWIGISYPVRWTSEWMERHQIPRWVLAITTTRDGMIGIRPSLTYTSSFTPLIGFNFFDRRFVGPGSVLNATLVGLDSHNVFTALHLRPTPEARVWEFDLDVAYNRRNDRLFNGIGFFTRKLPGTRYAIDEVNLAAHVHVIPAVPLRLVFGGLFGLRRFDDAPAFGGDVPISQIYCMRQVTGACIPGTVSDVLVPGFNQGTQFLRGTADLFVDTRDSRFRPSTGAVAHFGVQYSHGLTFDHSSYFRLHGGVEAVIDLWSRSRVLVVRVSGDTVLPTNDAPVPFTELVTLGGPDDLRGARPGRFRDFSALLLTLEYRWPVWMWMDAALFFDYGGVFGRWFADFDVRQLVPSLGGGVRIRTASQFFLRAQTAYGWGQGWQFFVGAQVEP